METTEGMAKVRHLSEMLTRHGDELLNLLGTGGVQLPIKGADKYVVVGSLAMIREVLPKDGAPEVAAADLPPLPWDLANASRRMSIRMTAGELADAFGQYGRAVLALARRAPAPADERDSFYWLVELRPAFEDHPAFQPTYYAGWMERPSDAAKTHDVHASPKFTSKEAAQGVADKLGHTLSCKWEAVEHGFHHTHAEPNVEAYRKFMEEWSKGWSPITPQARAAHQAAPAQPSAAPIYQARAEHSWTWADVDREVYELMGPKLRRIVYAAPTSDQQAGAVPVLIQALETGDDRESSRWFDITPSEVAMYREEGYKIRELYAAAPAAIEQAGAPIATINIVQWPNRVRLGISKVQARDHEIHDLRDVVGRLSGAYHEAMAARRALAFTPDAEVSPAEIERTINALYEDAKAHRQKLAAIEQAGAHELLASDLREILASAEGNKQMYIAELARESLALLSAPVEQAGAPTSKETDLSKRLREFARTGNAHGPDLLTQAADEIERYYGGMLAWKRTAEAKDAAFVHSVEQAGAPACSHNFTNATGGWPSFCLNCGEHQAEQAGAQPVAQAGPKAYCKACQAVGMSNCGNFDECDGATCITCHRPLNLAAPTPATDKDALDAKRWRKVVTLIGYVETANGPEWSINLPKPTRWGNTDSNFIAAIDSSLAATPVTDQAATKQENQQ